MSLLKPQAGLFFLKHITAFGSVCLAGNPSRFLVISNNANLTS